MEAASSLFWLQVDALVTNGDGMVAGPLRGFLATANERGGAVNKGLVLTKWWRLWTRLLDCQPPSASLYAPVSHSVPACDPPNPFSIPAVRPGAIAPIVRGTTAGSELQLTLPSFFFLFAECATIFMICIQPTDGHLVVSASVCRQS
jgi:hypothetical protein